MISAIVLAAGSSSRMGESKPLVTFRGRPLLEHTLDTVKASQVDDIVVVLGDDADRVRAGLALEGARVVVNDAYGEGMSASIRSGAHAAPDAEAFLVVLGDEPFVSVATLDSLLAARTASGAKILVPTYRGARGNPVLVDASLREEMERIAGDQGCRALFDDHGADLLEVPVDDPGVLIDLDTPEELERFERGTAEDIAAAAREIARRRHAHEAGGPGTDGEGRPQVDVLSVAHDLRAHDEPFALATVVRVERPTSGRPGYKAIVRPDRRLIGWLGGSCAESVLVTESLAAMRDGQPRMVRLTPQAGSRPPQDGIIEYVMECQSGGTMDLYIEPHLPRPRLVVVGDSPVADALLRIGRILEYRVVLVSPRSGDGPRPLADDVVTDLERVESAVAGESYAVVATMGKYDEAALRALLRTPTRYIGLVASRRRAAAVLEELRRTGFADEVLSRIESPAGVDIAAHTPEEIALSIAAAITRIRRTEGEKALAIAPAQVPAEHATARDVVCGMEVEPTTPLRVSHAGTMYFFCSETCRSRFVVAPGTFI